MNEKKGPNTPARVDADRTAKPLTEIVGHVNRDHCVGPGSVPPGLWRHKDGTAVPLGQDKDWKTRMNKATDMAINSALAEVYGKDVIDAAVAMIEKEGVEAVALSKSVKIETIGTVKGKSFYNPEFSRTLTSEQTKSVAQHERLHNSWSRKMGDITEEQYQENEATITKFERGE